MTTIIMIRPIFFQPGGILSQSFKDETIKPSIILHSSTPPPPPTHNQGVIQAVLLVMQSDSDELPGPPVIIALSSVYSLQTNMVTNFFQTRHP